MNVRDEPVEIEIGGTKFKIRELSGLEYIEIMDKCSDVKANGEVKFNRRKYTEELLKASIVEPEVDIKKLNAATVANLLVEIEKILGVLARPESFPTRNRK